VISLLSKLSSYYMHIDEMEEAPNKRNTLVSLIDDVFVDPPPPPRPLLVLLQICLLLLEMPHLGQS
jgi:hypothetical protein